MLPLLLLLLPAVAVARRFVCPAQATAADSEAQMLTAGLLAHETAPAGDSAAATAPTLTAHVPHASIDADVLAYSSEAWEVLHEVVQPAAILLLGVGFSVAALWVAVSALLPS